MKILWVVNIMLPEFAQRTGRSFSSREGWLSGLLRQVRQNGDIYGLHIAFPTDDMKLVGNVTVIDGVTYHAFYEDLSHPEYYVKDLEGVFKKLIADIDPDILHVFGTEFPHALSAVIAFNNPARTIVGMQGICRRIAEDYMAGIPSTVANTASFRDIIRKDWPRVQRRKFRLRAVSETAALRLAGNVIGRTEFDREAVLEINEELRYFCVNEIMRESFYEGSWNIDDARRHTIFTGQGDYPIKGLHFLIQSCGMLIKDYPDLEIKIAGNSIINAGSFKERMKLPIYGKYLLRLIDECGLNGHVSVTGMLGEESMKKEYLSAGLFVLPSYVENSPNTLSEAMLLGVPVVTSDAGGIKSMISESEGFIFPRGDVNKLAEGIRRVWELMDDDPNALSEMTQRCRKRALDEFDGRKNYESLMSVYNTVAGIEG
ncbi:MAG: glycosyltransferase family 4 protein [Lachnospiraceae bacterium]|nr:glycosyltransferase family 4 protein [Lachnospiraceae bacterium]